MLGADFCGKRAGFLVGHGLRRVQAPREPREGIRPSVGGGGHFLAEGIVNGGFLAGATEAEGFEVGAILAIELLGDGDEVRKGGFGGNIAQAQGDLAAHHGRGVGGHFPGELHDITAGGAEGTAGDEPCARLGGIEQLGDDGLAGISHLREQPDGAGGDVFVGIFQQRSHGGDGFFSICFQAGEAAVADVHGGAFQREDLAFGGGEVDLRNDGFETFRRDAVDGARSRAVMGAMAADARVEPIRHVKRAIGADGDIGGAEEGFDLVVGFAALEVGACEFAFLVGGEEIDALQLEARAIGDGKVAENDVLAGLAGEQQALPFRAERAVFIIGDTGGRAAAIDIAGGHGAGVFLPPLGGGGVLAGALVGSPRALAVGGGETGVAAFNDFRDAARGRVVVVGLEHVAEGGERLFVGVAVVVADDAGVRAVGIHPDGETSDPDISVVAGFPGDGAGVLIPCAAAALVIAAADAEGFAGLVGEDSAAVSVVEIPLAVRADGDGVQRVVVLAGVETREEGFALVHGGIEFPVAVRIGVNEEVGRLGDDDLVFKNGDAKRGFEVFLLRENTGGIRFAVLVGVLKDHDAVTFRALDRAAVVHALRDIEAAFGVEVDVGWVLQHRAGGPNGDLKAVVGEVEHFLGDERDAIAMNAWQQQAAQKDGAGEGGLSHGRMCSCSWKPSCRAFSIRRSDNFWENLRNISSQCRNHTQESRQTTSRDWELH